MKNGLSLVSCLVVLVMLVCGCATHSGNDFLKLEKALLAKDYQTGIVLVKNNPTLMGDKISSQPDNVIGLILRDERSLETIQMIIESKKIRNN